jgi:hypothetical protein
VWGQNTVAEGSKNGSEEGFARRVSECLVQVKRALQTGSPSSERSAERCLLILNAAVAQSNGSGKKGSVSAQIYPLASSESKIIDILKSVAHGMRGQTCYYTITIMAKRTTPHNGVPPVQSSQGEKGNIHHNTACCRPSMHTVLTQLFLFSIVCFKCIPSSIQE